MPAYHVTTSKRPFLERIRNITISASNGTGYLSTSPDGTTWSFFAGPLTASAGGGTDRLTAVADETAAQAAELSLPFNGRWVLPARSEARFVRLHHRSTGLYQLYEFYPRAEVVADDFVGEVFRGMYFNGQQIVADKLSALNANLGAVSISEFATIGVNGGIYQGTGTATSPDTGLKIWNQSGIGLLATYKSGVRQVDFDTDGNLNAGSGAVRLNATGLKTYNGVTEQVSIGADGTLRAGAGAVRLNAQGLKTYSGVTEQVSVGTNGAVTAGAGAVKLDVQGITFTARNLTTDPTGASSQPNNVTWMSGAAVVASVEGYTRASGSYLSLDAASQVLIRSNQVRIAAASGGSTLLNVFGGIAGSSLSITGSITSGQALTLGQTGGNGDAYMRVNQAGNAFLCLTGGAYQDFFSTGNTNSGAQIRLNSNQGIFGYGNLDLMAGAGGMNGEVRAFTNDALRLTIAKTGEVAVGTTPISGHRLRVQGVTSGSSGYTFVTANSGGSGLFWARDDGYLWANQGWTIGSDERMKDNLEDLTDGLALARQIKAKRYQRKRDTSGRWEIGVSAQEVQQVAPDMVVEAQVNDAGDTMLAVRYNDFIPVLLKAAQELDARDDEQDGQITQLRAAVRAIATKVGMNLKDIQP